MDLSERLGACFDLFRSHEMIWQNEVMDSYPHFDRHYPAAWPEELTEFSLDRLYLLEGMKNYEQVETPSLRDFLYRARDIRVMTERGFSADPSSRKLSAKACMGLRPKKALEIRTLAQELQFLQRQLNISQLVDLGGGRGLLAQVMANYYNFKVTSVDQELEFQRRGRELNLKNRRESAELVEFLPLKIAGDLEALRKRLEGEVISLGLHTCGDLAKLHLQSAVRFRSKAFLNLGCCYYKMEGNDVFLSSLGRKLAITNEALTLATRAHGNINRETFFHKVQVKTYRYMFHTLMKDVFQYHLPQNLGDSRWQLYYDGFPAYARVQFSRLGVSGEHLSDRYLWDFFLDEQRQKKVKRMIVCGVIRGIFGRPLELFITLDRALYLEENGFAVSIKSYFDEAQSPRNLGILGVIK